MRRLYLHLSIAVVMFSLVCLSASQLRAEFVSVPPPPLPIYDQPAIPGPGYVWVPGSWAYDDASGYYWVPGTWVIPPKPGLLWTPTYWSYNKELNAYGFHQGYWAEEVGFYGGIAYGYGYPGTGYAGGYWRGDKFFYNRIVNNLAGAPITDVFSQPVDAVASPVSFLGGPGGINIQINPQQTAVSKLPHVPLTADQKQQIKAARDDPGSFEKNGGPTVGGTKTAGKSHKDKDRSLNSEAKKRPRSGNQKVSNGGEIVNKGGNAVDNGAAGGQENRKTGEVQKTNPGGEAGKGATGGQENRKTGEAQKTSPVGLVGGAGGQENRKTSEAQKAPPGDVAGAGGGPETAKTAGKVVRPPSFNNDARQSGKQIAPPTRVQVRNARAPIPIRKFPETPIRKAPQAVRAAPQRAVRAAPQRVVRVAPQRAARAAPPRAVRAVPRVNRAPSRPQRRR